MKLVIFGLSISSSWGNGHATLWRGLCKALGRLGVDVVFFEHDAPYYAAHRDCATPAGATLVVYDEWRMIRSRVRLELRDADAAIVTSYCHDALAARAEILEAARPLAAFYDLDSPITIEAARSGEAIPWLDARGLADYDLVLSYAGGRTLRALHTLLHARAAHPLYGHVDPAVHRPVAPAPALRSDLCWLGTYAPDRQRALASLFLAAARARPDARFMLAGAQYPVDFPWRDNIWFTRHLPPAEHAAFLCSARLVLNVTRAPMVRAGWCPSGRLFETAACGVPIVTDAWPGLPAFYEPGSEILLARDTRDVLAAMDLSDAELHRIGEAGRERTLASHTSMHRACELVELLAGARTTRSSAEAADLPPLPGTAPPPGAAGPEHGEAVQTVLPSVCRSAPPRSGCSFFSRDCFSRSRSPAKEGAGATHRPAPAKTRHPNSVGIQAGAQARPLPPQTASPSGGEGVHMRARKCGV